MAVIVEDLKKEVLKNIKLSDKVDIISGFTTPDTIDEIASTGKNVEFIYGMYPSSGITEKTLEKLREIDKKFTTLDIRVATDYHVHTKCYLFYSNGQVFNALVGSANCSRPGLESEKNCEMLVEMNMAELSSNAYLSRLQTYYTEVYKTSLNCQDSSIIARGIKTKGKRSKKRHIPITGNPRVALLPLYSFDAKGRKYVPKASGLNWGLQGGHSRKGAGYAEAYIPITGEIVDNYPLMIPSFPSARVTTTGKSTRRYDSITVLWDDLTVMEMLFEGNGVERPTRSRPAGTPYFAYPKQLTSGTATGGGGAELGEYIRKRLGVSPRKVITMADLRKYGRDTIQLSYISPNYYEADFSV